MTTLTTVDQQIKRDHWGRPLVIPPGGGKPVPYTRVTTFVSVMEDTFNLSRWQQRMVAIGLSDRPDLALAVAAHKGDKDHLNKICQKAIEAAKASAKATTGTALHTLSELVDRGEDLPVLPDGARADIEAYRVATADLDMVAIEQFGVHDELQAAGTWDRIIQIGNQRYIGDLKTGSIEWGMNKIAQQLALYSRCQAYDPATGERTPLNVDQNNGLIIHLPSGEAKCELLWVNLRVGWDAVQLAHQVRKWRKVKGLTAPFKS